MSFSYRPAADKSAYPLTRGLGKATIMLRTGKSTESPLRSTRLHITSHHPCSRDRPDDCPGAGPVPTAKPGLSSGAFLGLHSDAPPSADLVPVAPAFDEAL